MRLRFEQLEGHLRQPLLPIYLVSGDEPLQRAEACDAIRAAAREQGFSEREVMHVEGGFDWGELQAASDALSLFAERRIIELRMPSPKPGKEGGAALAEYAANPPSDNLLLIDCGKLEKAQQNGKWFKALDKAGAVLQVWPVEAGRLPGWISERMRRHGLQPSREAAQLLAEMVEGNMLAADQEIAKLALLHPPGPLGVEAVEAAAADSVRYDNFELVDAAFNGEAARCRRMLDGLRGEGEEPLKLLAALLFKLRQVEPMARAVAAGVSPGQAMKEARVFQKSQGPTAAMLSRHPLRRIQTLVGRAARVDRMVKGAEPGNPWDELMQLTLLIAGVRLV